MNIAMHPIFILKPNTECTYCKSLAVRVAHLERGNKLVGVCENHSFQAAGKGKPQYIVECPNCDCVFGVN